jgi:hypothetical protein
MTQKIVFSNADYAVFLTSLILSALIGFYFAWKERKKKSIEHVLLGGRKLKVMNKNVNFNYG